MLSVLPPDLTADFFSPAVGARFEANIDGVSFALTLVEIELLTSGRPGHRAPFLLLFDAPAGARVVQGTHHLSHETLGSFDVFLVPAQPGPTRAPRLAATFS